MRTLADKGVIACGCVVLVLLPGDPDAIRITWLLAAVVASGAASCLTATGGSAVAAGYLVAGCLSPWSLPGAPLVVHDLARGVTLGSRSPWLLLGFGAPLLVAARRGGADPSFLAACAAVSALAVVLAVRTAQGELARAGLHALRDDLQQKVTELQDTNARLLEAQDNEARAVALAERTRIARDIHDTVGHLLTRGVLRARALQVVHRDEPAVVSELSDLGATLDEALDSMRRSVHALSDEGQDLPTALNLLGARCGIDDVVVDCLLDSPPPPAVARCLIAVAREALTNAVRHGRAGSARVGVVEYPAFWQITVDNDGVTPEPTTLGRDGTHLGLRSMRDRVESLGGAVRFTPRPRFTVFATIPKETP